MLKTKSSIENVAVTVQSPVIAPVVYVSPASEPPQPETVPTWYGGVAVTVNVVVAPSSTVCGVSGVIVPPLPALGVTVCVLIANVAVTVQSYVIAPVV